MTRLFPPHSVRWSFCQRQGENAPLGRRRTRGLPLRLLSGQIDLKEN
jgi:hypothetical protein